MAQLLGAYYNEHDPKAAAWLRELIKGGHIAPGEVDERDIRDVTPDDLRGFRQHHFFAGIGVWSYALRLAGWPDDRPVWTGSCPCQPFSSAGKRKGTADDRHLWPAFHWLIRQHRPGVVFGEQVASKDGITWLDTVSTDLEAEGYAVGPVVLPACGVGAPHIRQRLWFVADTNGASSEWRAGGIPGEEAAVDSARIKNGGQPDRSEHGGQDVVMAHSDGGDAGPERKQRSGEQRQLTQNGGADALALDARGGCGVLRREVEPGSDRHADGSIHSPGELADASGEQCDPGRVRAAGIESGEVIGSTRHGLAAGATDVEGRIPPPVPGAVNGGWRDADWIYCRDGRWRAVEPGSFPLAHGAPARVGRLRGYGNAIVAQAAAEVISTYMEVRDA